MTKTQVVQVRAFDTRDKIFERSIHAFAELGFDGTSLTTDILEPAGVSVGSFYHQFSNKREVLIELLDMRRETRRNRIAELKLTRQRNSLSEALIDALQSLFDEVDIEPETCMIQFREEENPDPSIRTAVRAGWDAWERLAREVVSAYFDSTSPALNAAAELVITMLNAALRLYVNMSPQDRAERKGSLIYDTAEFCEAGVARLIDGRD
jgi:AcrR family transcriptional regulator